MKVNILNQHRENVGYELDRIVSRCSLLKMHIRYKINIPILKSNLTTPHKTRRPGTRARTRHGQDAECKIYKSAWFGNLSAYSWKIPFTVFITPERFRAFRRLPERANFPRRDFGLEQNLDAEMNFLRTSSGHPACLQGFRIFRILRKRSWRFPHCG